MYKFIIDYDYENGTGIRTATVYAEDLERAVEKIEAVDPEYRDLVSVNFTEKPGWRNPEE